MTKMNVWRGLFRLWVVGAIGWTLFVGALTLDKVQSPSVPFKYFAVYGSDMTLYEWTEQGTPRIDGGYQQIDFPNNVVVYAAKSYQGETLNDWARRFAK